jgi:hypothetical protein
MAQMFCYLFPKPPEEDSQKMTKDRELMLWKEKVKALSPTASKQEKSPARERISVGFEEVTEAKGRGVTWQQLASLMNTDGVRTEAGEPLTADIVRALYHSERYVRGLRKKRRPKKPAAQAAMPQLPRQQDRDTVAFDPGDGDPQDKPKPKFSISRPKR